MILLQGTYYSEKKGSGAFYCAGNGLNSGYHGLPTVALNGPDMSESSCGKCIVLRGSGMHPLPAPVDHIQQGANCAACCTVRQCIASIFLCRTAMSMVYLQHFIFLVLKLGFCCAISVQRAFCIFNLTSICLLAVSVCVIWCLSIPTRTGVIPVVVQVSVQVKLLPKGWAQHLSQHHRRMLPSITSAQNAATATLTSMFLILRP